MIFWILGTAAIVTTGLVAWVLLKQSEPVLDLLKLSKDWETRRGVVKEKAHPPNPFDVGPQVWIQPNTPSMDAEVIIVPLVPKSGTRLSVRRAPEAPLGIVADEDGRSRLWRRAWLQRLTAIAFIIGTVAGALLGIWVAVAA